MESDRHMAEDAERLVHEIGCYLAMVDLVRATGREPTWRPEHPVRGRPRIDGPRVDRAERPVLTPRFTV